MSAADSPRLVTTATGDDDASTLLSLSSSFDIMLRSNSSSVVTASLLSIYFEYRTCQHPCECAQLVTVSVGVIAAALVSTLVLTTVVLARLDAFVIISETISATV